MGETISQSNEGFINVCYVFSWAHIAFEKCNFVVLHGMSEYLDLISFPWIQFFGHSGNISSTYIIHNAEMDMPLNIYVWSHVHSHVVNFCCQLCVTNHSEETHCSLRLPSGIMIAIAKAEDRKQMGIMLCLILTIFMWTLHESWCNIYLYMLKNVSTKCTFSSRAIHCCRFCDKETQTTWHLHEEER